MTIEGWLLLPAGGGSVVQATVMSKSTLVAPGTSKSSGVVDSTRGSGPHAATGPLAVPHGGLVPRTAPGLRIKWVRVLLTGVVLVFVENLLSAGAVIFAT